MNIIEGKAIQRLQLVNPQKSENQHMRRKGSEASYELLGDWLEISEKGKRMGRMMQPMGKVAPPEVMGKIDFTLNSIESLQLDKLDPEEMTDEELSETLTGIEEFISSFGGETTLETERMISEKK